MMCVYIYIFPPFEGINISDYNLKKMYGSGMFLSWIGAFLSSERGLKLFNIVPTIVKFNYDNI